MVVLLFVIITITYVKNTQFSNVCLRFIAHNLVQRVSCTPTGAKNVNLKIHQAEVKSVI